MPYLVGIGQNVNDPQTSATAFVPLPPHLTNDILLIVVGSDESPSGVSIDGFTKKYELSSQATRSIQVWWKRAASGSESNPSITHTFTTDNVWIPLVIRGCPGSGDPFDATAGDDTEAGTSHVAPAVTTTADDAGILIIDSSVSNPGYTAISNATINPRIVFDTNSPTSGAGPDFGGQGMGIGWGHQATTGDSGTTTITLSASVTSSVATLALKHDTSGLIGASTFRDSILSTEPASASTITLPTHATDDLLVAVVSSNDQTKTFATTLSGFTKIQEVGRRATWGRGVAVYTKRAASASETNPTITHTFGGADDWTVIIFSVTGSLGTFGWCAEPSADPVVGAFDVEAGAAAKVVAVAATDADLTVTSLALADATGETEQEDGGAATAKLIVYTADLAAAGWVGAATWDLSVTGTLSWIIFSFSTTTAAASSIPTITFSVPGAAEEAGDGTYRIAVDWANDGNFTSTGDDVTDRVRWPTVSASRGNTAGRRILPPQAGAASYLLDNQSGDYYPDNGSSPLTGNIKPGRRTRIRSIFEGVIYDLWTGFIDDLDINPALWEKSVGITALGPLSKFVDKAISTAVHLGKDTGTLIGEVLDAIGWPAADREIDVGATIVSVWWEEGTSAYQALTRLLFAEGPGALLYEDGEGKIVFKNRFFKLLDTRAKTSQATFADPPEIGYIQFEYDHGWADIINSVTMEVVRRGRVGTKVVWEHGSSFTVPATSTVSVTAKASDPFIGAVTPVIDTDFTQSPSGPAAVTVTLNRTSGQAVTISLENTSGTAVIVSGLQLRAQPLEVSSRVVVSDEDATSVADYGERDDGRDYTWVQYPELAADLIDGILLDRKTPRRKVRITLRSGEEVTDANMKTRLRQALSREIGDRITITQTRSSLSRDFWIEHIEHQLDQAGKIHTTTFLCEETRDGVVAASDIFILDSATQGVLGTNKLGA